MRNFGVLQKFCAENDWMEFLAKDASTRSNTSVCLVVKDLSKPEVAVMLKMLDRNGVAYDIASYRDAPAGLRIWYGADASSLRPHTPVASGRVLQ